MAALSEWTILHPFPRVLAISHTILEEAGVEAEVEEEEEAEAEEGNSSLPPQTTYLHPLIDRGSLAAANPISSDGYNTSNFLFVKKRRVETP